MSLMRKRTAARSFLIPLGGRTTYVVGLGALSTRRCFIIHAVAAGSALGTTLTMAQGAPKLEETDPQAVALGYKHDATKVDEAKYPKHLKTDACSGCQLFQGKPKEATGACPIFAGKQVAAAGWCSAWAKKVG